MSKVDNEQLKTVVEKVNEKIDGVPNIEVISEIPEGAEVIECSKLKITIGDTITYYKVVCEKQPVYLHRLYFKLGGTYPIILMIYSSKENLDTSDLEATFTGFTMPLDGWITVSGTSAGTYLLNSMVLSDGSWYLSYRNSFQSSNSLTASKTYSNFTDGVKKL